MCVEILLSWVWFPLLILCSFLRLCLIDSSNMRLVLLCTVVRVKRPADTVLFLSRKAAARLSECVDIVEVASLKQSKRCQPPVEEKKQLGERSRVGCSGVTTAVVVARGAVAEDRRTRQETWR